MFAAWKLWALFSQFWGSSTQRCQTLELGNENFIWPTQWARQWMLSAEKILGPGVLWLLWFQRKVGVPSCFAPSKLVHIGSCPSRAILSFYFWRWLTTASCVGWLWKLVRPYHYLFYKHCGFVSSISCLYPNTEQSLCPLQARAPFWVLVFFCSEALLSPLLWSTGHGTVWLFREKEDTFTKALNSNPIY